MANSLTLEQFKNGAISQLTFGVGLTDSTIGVQNAGLFPSIPQFRLLVDSEYMLATGVNPAPTSGPTATDGGAAATPLHAGAFNVTYTWVMAGGESTQSPNGAVTLALTGNKINIAQISSIPSYVSSLKFYFNGAVPAGDTNGFIISQNVSGGTVAAFSITTEGNATVAPASENIFNVTRGQETSIATTHLASASVVGPLTAGSLQNFGMVKIDEFLLTVAAASVTFTSIPQIFRHLLILYQARMDGAVASANCGMQFNSDVGANYSFQYIQAGNVTVSSNSGLAQTLGNAIVPTGANAPASQPGSGEIFFYNYAQTTFFKAWRGWTHNQSTAAATGTLTIFESGTWSNTAAINSIKILSNSGNWVVGSVFSLYGIP